MLTLIYSYNVLGAQEDPTEFNGSTSPNEETEDIGMQFTEIFAKKKENIALLLDLLAEYDLKSDGRL